jgi:hypothetical protein
MFLYLKHVNNTRKPTDQEEFRRIKKNSLKDNIKRLFIICGSFNGVSSSVLKKR